MNATDATRRAAELGTEHGREAAAAWLGDSISSYRAKRIAQMIQRDWWRDQYLPQPVPRGFDSAQE